MGKSVTYQTSGPDVTEAAMLEHLREAYQNLTIISIKRIEPGDIKPRIGFVESHAFMYGIRDAVAAELRGHVLEPKLFADRHGKVPKSVVSLLEKSERYLKPLADRPSLLDRRSSLIV